MPLYANNFLKVGQEIKKKQESTPPVLKSSPIQRTQQPESVPSGNHHVIIADGKHRKIAVRYGTDEYYKNILSNFESQRYPSLYPTDLVTYHYAWFRQGKYLQLRFDQLNRPEYYWKYFIDGINHIKEFKYSQICMKPDKTGTYRYVSAINMPHPEAIKSHPSYAYNIDIDSIINNNQVVDYK